MMKNENDAPDPFDVIVVGAGIAGLALTRELYRRDIKVVALERRMDLVDSGLAINLPGNAIAALNRLGLGNDLKQVGNPITRREYRSSGGRLLFKVDEVDFWGSDNAPRCMRRSDLAALLMKDVPAYLTRYQSAVTSATASGNSATVTTSDGQRLEASYLVGADGVHSIVRKLCFQGGSASFSQLAQRSWRFIGPNPGVDCWTVWMGQHAIVLLIPLGPDEVYGWATVTHDKSSAQDPRILLQHMAGFASEPRRAVEEALSTPDRLFTSPLHEIRLSDWSCNRAILIGDAAHATAPVWAQGAALALEDSIVLADLISGNADPQSLGEQFTRQRRDRVRHVQAMTDRAAKVSRLPAPVRNLLMPLLGPLSYKNTYGPLRTT
jgi:2-polyprenyl-6-methoxyphenol hydroxylase-like FAD-dependent oxidoreductase